MPRFEPFPGLRYDEAIDLNQVTAPPYDVIDAEQRTELAARTPYNIIHVDMPDEHDGASRYRDAARRLVEWQHDGVLTSDPEPSFYVYRMGYQDEHGRPRQTTGVIGALEVAEPGESDVLPHEHTTPKAKSDRLELTRATTHNLSPIWGLSLASGLSDLLEVTGPPVGRCTDELGVHHRLWRVTAAAIVDAVRERVASAPVVIADGHHRYETALAYRAERRQSSGDDAGPWDLTLALVVELTESELAVRPIHRLLHGLPDRLHLPAVWADRFETFESGPADERLPDRMADAGALALVVPDGQVWLLRPRDGAFPPDLPDLDASRLDAARDDLPEHEVEYQHGVDNVLRRVAGGEAAAGVLLRPATVAQIAEMAHRRERMPPKTTYFHPKPRTGMVLRSLA